jgi:hypothetical protein
LIKTFVYNQLGSNAQEERASNYADKIQVLEDLFAVLKNEMNSTNYLKEKFKSLEYKISLLNQLNLNQTQQIAKLNERQTSDVLALKQEKQTQNKELNFTLIEKILNLENRMGLLNAKSEKDKEKIEYLGKSLNKLEREFQEFNQNQSKQLTELKNVYKEDFLQLINKKNDLTTFNLTFSENIQNLKDKFSSMMNQFNGLNDSLFKNFVKKPVYSLVHNVSIENMKSKDYEIAYDVVYSHKTTISELNAIKSKCSVKSILCAGGAKKGSDILLLVSCGNCQNVLTATQKNKPVLNNGAYWYLTDKKSFGFSPSYNIKQHSVDWFDCDSDAINCSDEKRLSWNLGGGGGWRLGKLNYDENTIGSYRKIILIS